MKVLIEISNKVKKNIDGYAAGHKAYQLSLQDVNNLAKIIANGEVVKDTLIDLEPTLERYRKESDTWDENGLTPFEITEKMDTFCADEMRGILGDYFSKKMQEGLVIVREGDPLYNTAYYKDMILNIALAMHRMDDKALEDLFETSSIIDIFNLYSVKTINNRCFKYIQDYNEKLKVDTKDGE